MYGKVDDGRPCSASLTPTRIALLRQTPMIRHGPDLVSRSWLGLLFKDLETLFKIDSFGPEYFTVQLNST